MSCPHFYLLVHDVDTKLKATWKRGEAFAQSRPPLHTHELDDDLSDLSDGEGYFYPLEDGKIEMHGLRVKNSRLKRIKDVYFNTDKVSSFCNIFQSRKYRSIGRNERTYTYMKCYKCGK